RRRHTRCYRDWSSDVCSSDLGPMPGGGENPTERGAWHVLIGIAVAVGIAAGAVLALLAVQVFGATGVGKARRVRRQLIDDAERRSEERRVGEEWGAERRVERS